jgi:hypothetical protein
MKGLGMDKYGRRVFEAEAPCDKCDQAPDCKEYEKACRAFSYYVLHGYFESYTVRHPSRGLFNKIFKEDDKALKNYLKSVKTKEEMGKNDLFEK